MPQCKYKPLFARVLIEREVKQKSSGGIIIPDAQRHAKLTGKIIAVGPTVDETIKPGMQVVFGAHAGKWLDASYDMTTNTKDDAPYFICQDEDLLLEVTGG